MSTWILNSELWTCFIYVGSFFQFWIIASLAYRVVCKYIKVWIVDNAIKTPKGLFGMYFYGFSIIKVGWNDKTSGCNSQTGYKMKLLKHGGTGQ